MRKLILLLVGFNMMFAFQVSGLPIPGGWHFEEGIAAVFTSEGDDSSPVASPGNAYYWSFESSVRTKNIPGDLIDNEDEMEWHSAENYRTGGTYAPHGDNLWGPPVRTIYGGSVESYFSGKTYYHYYQLIDDEWVWQSTIGSSKIKGKFTDYPFRTELTGHVYFDYYGYSDIVRYNVFSGKVTDAVKSIFPIPEPSTMLLFGAGIGSLTAVRRKRK